VDWDVHHGNGSQDIFYEDPDVFYFSSHRFPYYPGTGSSVEDGAWPAKGSTLNLPMPPGSGDQDFLNNYNKFLVPQALAFKPDLVLISCGFDTHWKDPLGGMAVTDKGFALLTQLVVKIANQTCSGRIISFLEGGYDLEAVASSAVEHVRQLMA
jgi:acetoin utilization deacetylase AcuC-like enzyme